MKLSDIFEARYAGSRRTVDDYHLGDLIVLTWFNPRRSGEQIQKIGQVRYVSHKRGLVTFHGIRHPEYVQAVDGSFIPEKLGHKGYGLMDVEVIQRGNLQEATYYRDPPPILKQIVNDIFDPEAPSHYDIPEALSYDDVVGHLTNMIGEEPARKHHNHVQWILDLPKSVLRAPLEQAAYVSYYKSQNMVMVFWDDQ
jgi:hypothetical protein